MSSGNLGCKEEERASSLICVSYNVEFLVLKKRPNRVKCLNGLFFNLLQTPAFLLCAVNLKLGFVLC
jgi:hypothetical protein